MTRSNPSPEVATDVLVRSRRRRYCVSFAVGVDSVEKQGQIAHLDRDPANNAVDTLVFFCLNHHDKYDSRTL